MAGGAEQPTDEGYNAPGVASAYVSLFSKGNPYNVFLEHNVARAFDLAGCSLDGATVADAGCGDGRWCVALWLASGRACPTCTPSSGP